MSDIAITTNTQYLTVRLQQLGVTDEQNTFERVWYQDSSEKSDDGNIITRSKEHSRSYKHFEADRYGNIIIRYFNLDGQPYRFHKDDAKMAVDYTRKRLVDPKADFKYWQEKGSPQFPYFTPGIIATYKKNKEAINIDGSPVVPIETLFVVEGEFKAFKGDMCGLDIIGLPSIHGFYNGDVKGKLHEDIQELIITCGVQKIVFLVDADLLTLKWEANKDLHKRAASFYGSIKAFRESLQLLLDDSTVKLELCYFMHIQTKFVNDAKGLDDLLCKYESVQKNIVADLHKLNFARDYFEGKSILDQSKDVQGNVANYLGVTNEQEFYKTYQEFIGNREFKYKRRRYIYDTEKKEVVFVKHEDAEKFMRIGPDWVKVITTINKHSEPEEELVPWKISEIQRDYAKKYPDFIDTIVRYDGFCNEPNFNSTYQQSLHNCYNVFRPLKWAPKQGSITNTVQFIKHLFGGNGNIILDASGKFEREDAFLGDQFTVALDYLTIMMKHPKHMLPVPCLVSPENNTGKSTFLKWLQMILGDNMCILGNAQFQMKFNGHYATKYVISIDEGFLEVDKKAEKERLKQLVTADSIYMEMKGMNVRKIPYYAKIIICSNDADRLMKIDEGESRWFVVRVPVIPKEKKDPDLELKMKAEAEAWLHFIHNRPIFHPREDRLWFHSDRFITDQFKIIVGATKNRIDRVFEEWIHDQFMMYEHDTLQYSLKYITEQMNDAKTSKYKVDSLDIKTYLKSKGLSPADRPSWINVPVGFKNDGTIPTKNGTTDQPSKEIQYQGYTARPYTFYKSDWIKESLLGNIVRNSIEGDSKQNIESRQIDDLPF